MQILHFLQEFVGNLLAFLLVLGVLIYVHEFGHFLAAKLLGVKVEVFSFGFGPRLFGRKRGETDYRVSAVPLGGYVRLLGEMPEEEPVTPDPRSLLAKPRWARFLIFFMGPALNVVLAFFLFTGLFMAGWFVASDQEIPPVIGRVIPGGPAEAAGLRPGDRIVRIGDAPMDSWKAVAQFVPFEGGKTLPVEVDREGQLLKLPVTFSADRKHRLGEMGAEPLGAPALVDLVSEGLPAEKGGIRPGDLIEKIDGKPVGQESARETIQANPGRPLQFTILRAGERLTLAITPDPAKGIIGVQWNRIFVRKGPIQAMGLALHEMRDQSGLLFKTLRRLVSGDLSMRAISGPIEIAKISGDSARQGGLRGLIYLMGMISLQLGILNLLPIPVLDGGHILISVVEGMVRRDLSIALKEKIQTVGFFIILGFMGVVIVFDFLKLDFVARWFQ